MGIFGGAGSFLSAPFLVFSAYFELNLEPT
jgi:hypothetical protein